MGTSRLPTWIHLKCTCAKRRRRGRARYLGAVSARPVTRHPASTRTHPTNRARAGLDAGQIDELRAFGVERAVSTGRVLFRAGDLSYDFMVILDGAVEILRVDGDGETLITVHPGPGGSSAS